ncbi:MAG: hypothetical protein LBG59_06005 [Candidatus Peribacteria bacterium]|jgi:hypothetical protein|nr:hypothetical protein [Candidatus Peribacteria bacterium]
MTKITPTIAQTEKDSNTRRSDKVYNFEKPRNPYDKPKNITSSAATEIAKSLITQEKQVIQNKANKLLESITYT